MKITEQPVGIILTVSRGMYEANGYRHWLKNFLDCMTCDECHYSFRAGGKVKTEVQYIYLIIGGKIRFRIYFGGSSGSQTRDFDDGRSMWAKAWIFGAGPVTRPPQSIKMKGFQGFRYTHEIF